MAIKYKVWIHIEKIDEERNLYEDVSSIDCPQSVGEFKTYTNALALVDFLQDICVSETEDIEMCLPEKEDNDEDKS